MIVRFEQDADEPYGTGMFYSETGKGIYTHDPDTAQSFVPTLKGAVGGADSALKQQVEQESAALSPMPDPRTGPDERTADNSGYSGTNTSNMTPVTPAVSPTVQALADSTHRLNPAPSQAQAPRAAAPSLQVTGRTQTSQPGRPQAAVDEDIQASRTATQLRKDANVTSATNNEERQASSYAAQHAEYDKVIKDKQAQQDDANTEAQWSNEEIRRASEEKDQPVDPNRIVNNMSTGKLVGITAMAAIFDGLAAVGGRQGGFAPAFRKAIDEDIKVQEDQIAEGRVSRNNRISYWRARGADARQSKIMARQDVNEAIKQNNLLIAQEAANKGAAMDAANQLNAGLDADQVKFEANLKNEAQGRSSYSTTYSDPTIKAAGAEGKAVKLEKDQIDLEAKQRDLADADSVSKILDPTGARKVSPAAAKEIKNDSDRIDKEEASLAPAKITFENYVKSMGGSVNMETGEVQWPGGKDGDLEHVGVGARLWRNMPLVTDQTGDLRDALIEDVTKMKTGASATVKQDATFKNMVGGNLTNPEKVKNNVEAFGQTLWGVTGAIRDGNPDAAKYHDRVSKKGKPTTTTADGSKGTQLKPGEKAE